MATESRQTECNGHIVRYGRNAQENRNLVENAEGCDIWFHVEDHASAHVICERDSRFLALSEATIEFCAKLCVERTPSLWRKGLKKVNVMYTPVSNLKLGKTPGEVMIKNEDETNVWRVKADVLPTSS